MLPAYIIKLNNRLITRLQNIDNLSINDNFLYSSLYFSLDSLVYFYYTKIIEMLLIDVFFKNKFNEKF